MALGWVPKGSIKGPKGDPGAAGKSIRSATVDIQDNTDVAVTAIVPSTNLAVDDLIVDAAGELYTVTAVGGDTVHVSPRVGNVSLRGPEGPQGPKGDPGDGADVPLATDTVAGRVKVGSDFDYAEDGTISLYKAISLTSLTGGSNNEVGSTVDSVTLTWDWNKQPTSLALDGTELERGEDGAFPKSRALAKQGIKSDRTFTLVATDARGAKSTKTTSVTFQNKAYWGVGAADATVDSAFLLALGGSALTGTKARTFTVDAGAGEYVFYAVPHALGTPKFSVGGFEGGFALLATIDHTNAAGHTDSYDVWRSDNSGLGATTVTAS